MSDGRPARRPCPCAPKKFVFSAVDRLIFVDLYRLFPKVCDALAVVKPDTIVRWHRAGFRSYWRWKSRPRGGRPTVPLEIRGLIREMSITNPLWGAPRIHGELLKLGIEVGQSSVASIWLGEEVRHLKGVSLPSNPRRTASQICPDLICSRHRPMARSSSEDFDQWAFVTGRRRRAPHGKRDMQNG